MRTDPRVPACWKSSRTSSSVAWNERFPTKSLVNIAATSYRTQDRASLFPARLRRVGHCAPADQHAPTGSRIGARAWPHGTEYPIDCQGTRADVVFPFTKWV